MLSEATFNSQLAKISKLPTLLIFIPFYPHISPLYPIVMPQFHRIPMNSDLWCWWPRHRQSWSRLATAKPLASAEMIALVSESPSTEINSQINSHNRMDQEQTRNKHFHLSESLRVSPSFLQADFSSNLMKFSEFQVRLGRRNPETICRRYDWVWFGISISFNFQAVHRLWTWIGSTTFRCKLSSRVATASSPGYLNTELDLVAVKTCQNAVASLRSHWLQMIPQRHPMWSNHVQ